MLSGASTPPRLRVRRRSRYLTIPAAVLLAACMSVPAVQCGGEQLYPYHLPVATWPHVAGLVVADSARNEADQVFDVEVK